MKKNKDFSLVEYLRNHDFWIRIEAISYMCKKMNYTMDLIGYYRDIRVWLPEVQCRIHPPCPKCERTNAIGAHSFDKDHTVRRIIGLNSTLL